MSDRRSLPVPSARATAPRRTALCLALAGALLAGVAPVARAQAPAQAQRPPPRAEKPAPRPPAKARAPAAHKPKPEGEAEPDATATPRLPASTQAQLRALLSAPNRRALNVDRMPPAQAEALRRSLLEAFTLGQASANDGGFESSIAGRFDGWNGDTVVRLLDGTRWRQVDGAVVVHHAFMPPVTVYRSGTTHRMRIEGLGRSVSVEPLAAAGRGAAPPADGTR
jgi:hypothetical protein